MKIMLRGRRANADSMVVVLGGRGMPPPPPAELTPEQAQVWADTLSAVPPDWLLPGAFPVMVAYTRHVCRAARLATEIEGFRAEWVAEAGGLERLDLLHRMAERETRSAIACARSLRLTPASTVRPETAGRAVSNFRPGRQPWDKLGMKK